MIQEATFNHFYKEHIDSRGKYLIKSKNSERRRVPLNFCSYRAKHLYMIFLNNQLQKWTRTKVDLLLYDNAHSPHSFDLALSDLHLFCGVFKSVILFFKSIHADFKKLKNHHYKHEISKEY